MTSEPATVDSSHVLYWPRGYSSLFSLFRHWFITVNRDSGVKAALRTRQAQTVLLVVLIISTTVRQYSSPQIGFRIS